MGATVDRNPAADTVTFLLLTRGFEVQCESVYHDTDGDLPHHGPARYWQVGRCRHTTGFRCEPSVLSAMGWDWIRCDQCRASWSITEFDFRRLE